MGNLNPGGSRAKGGRVFTHTGIRRMIQQHKPEHAAGADQSLADKPHANSREAARRARQEARKEAKGRA
jgi:hypothetical protein